MEAEAPGNLTAVEVAAVQGCRLLAVVDPYGCRREETSKLARTEVASKYSGLVPTGVK